MPSPEPPDVGAEKKVKKKSVRWVQEESLVNVRWFKKVIVIPFLTPSLIPSLTLS